MNFRLVLAFKIILNYTVFYLRFKRRRTPLNMSSPGGLTYLFNTAYGVGKAAQDRMAQDFNVELKGTGVYALAIWPGAVRTELIQEHVLDADDTNLSLQQQGAKKVFSDAQTTDWVGRTVAQLLDDPNIASKAGRVIWCHDVRKTIK